MKNVYSEERSNLLCHCKELSPYMHKHKQNEDDDGDVCLLFRFTVFNIFSRLFYSVFTSNIGNSGVNLYTCAIHLQSLQTYCLHATDHGKDSEYPNRLGGGKRVNKLKQNT
ncbi:CLUMA_CG005140, isoform A [Clunio marinus]|uniref:CLUMA_CG005140, isoform A n=1 Tax=Clunio marinus TaxID=568069 RepID=A0A1J1HZB9_9DIPT|nr:CLUMA_CG005140, isoform A [Clunio marinus]